jgi:hypothetical protein
MSGTVARFLTESRREGRRSLGACVLLIVLSCLGIVSAGAAESTSGTVIGRAVSCSAPALISVAHLSVYKGNKLVSKGSLPTGSQFHFQLPPGTYVISNQGSLGDSWGVHPSESTLRGRAEWWSETSACRPSPAPVYAG